MAKKMLIDATHAEETRVVVVDGNRVEDFDFESENKRQLAGNIYLAKVTRVEPSLQAAFVEYGGNRHGFLAFSEIHPDYYQIPVADREALLAEELAYDQSQDEDDPVEPAASAAEADAPAKPRRTRTRRSRGKRGADDTGEAGATTAAGDAATQDEVARDATDIPARSIPGMDVVDLGADDVSADVEDMNDPGLQRVPNVAVSSAPEAEAPAPALDTGAGDAPAAQDLDQDTDQDPVMGDAGSDPDGDADRGAGAPSFETPAAVAATGDGDADGADDTAGTDPDGHDDTPRTPPGTMAARHDVSDAVMREDVDTADDTTTAQDDERPEPDDAVQEMETDSAGDRTIESVGDDDSPDDIRPPRKPRPRRYKIQEVIKVRQIMLVQVVKEERGNKGAALTTYLSLAGRYCVLMPNTARGGGISRKITNVQDRKKLKEIAQEIDVPRGAGLIIRTAGANRTKAEIRRDYEYLQRLWEQIRDLTLKSVAPAAIYAEGDLIKRTIRDLYNRDIDEVLVEGEGGYRTAKDFMRMIMPSHAKNVKLYAEAQPLFARFQVESYLSEMFNPSVRLKSGGYIVIGVTEALVAIDVNSGKSTKEGSIEDTALKTNLEAAEEVARQCRLRDLAGLIVIDFIDMDERRNNAAVEKRFKDKLKTDRARIQVGRISGFGLLEMSRQRLRPGMLEASTQPCPHCHGTGLVRSDDNLALSILRELEEEGVRNRSGEVLVKAPVAIANYLINEKREHVARIEMRYGMAVRIEADPTLISPDFSVEKFKTATRVVRQQHPVISIDMSQMPDDDLLDLEAEEAEAAERAKAAQVAEIAPTVTDRDTDGDAPDDRGKDDAGKDDPGKPRKKRRRRRRRRGGASGEGEGADDSGQDQRDDDGDADGDGTTADRAVGAAPGEGGPAVAATDPDPAAHAAAPGDAGPEAVDMQPDTAGQNPVAAGLGTDLAADQMAETATPGTADAVPADAVPADAVVTAAAAPEMPAETRAAATVIDPPRAPAAEPDTAGVAGAVRPGAPADHPEPVAAPVPVAPHPARATAGVDPAEPDADAKPRKRGWWSAGR